MKALHFGHPRRLVSVVVLVALPFWLGVTSLLLAQGSGSQPSAPSPSKVRVVGPNTPLRSGPGVSNPPVVFVAAGTLLDVIGQEGDWYQVSLGADLAPKPNSPHTAYVLARLVELVGGTGTRSRLGSLNQNLQGLPTWPAESAVGSTEEVVQLDFARLMVRRGSQTSDVECAVIYDDDTMTVAPYDLKKDEPDPTVAIRYMDIVSAQYTFGKSPKLPSTGASAPVSGSNSHWLVVTARNGDTTVMTLDKANYKRVIAELETRARIRVDTTGPAK